MKLPEHDKVLAIKKESQTIGAFLEWLGEQGYSICSLEIIGQNIMREDLHEWFPTGRSTNTWLEEYFEIDGAELNREKKQILVQLRKGLSE